MNIKTSSRWPAPTLLTEVRTGGLARLGNTDIMSAIEKSVRTGKVNIGPLGLEGDMQGTSIIHGGPEKAVLHYAAGHYAAWIRELPNHAKFFRTGGFGENLVSDGMDETNICIGDVIRIGSTVLQVVQPRQPCFKLNHRFYEPSMTQRAQDSGRTGWYYRVLEPGAVEAGDTIKIIERLHSGWTVRRVQHYLYNATLELPAIRELATLESLAQDMRELFAKRVESKVVESWTSRTVSPSPMELPLT
jgi:MOSC domain-containing protein YiiM